MDSASGNPYRTSNKAAPIKSARGYQHGSERDELESPEDAWSGPDSGNEVSMDQNGSNESRGVKRKRPVTVSCELCKQRKVKCDRTQPSCGWCSRNGHTCEYKERKKPGLRAGYGRELEQRLDRLEEIIQSQGRLIETHIVQRQPRLSHDFHPDAPSYSSPSEPSAPHGPSPGTSLFFHEPPPNIQTSNIPSHGAHGINNILNQEPSLPTPSDTTSKNGIQPQLQDKISPTSVLPQLVEPRRSDYAHNGTSLGISAPVYTNAEQSLADPDPDLPPYDLLYALVNLYFEHINTWCPILHRTTTMDSLFGATPLEEEDRMVLYAIVATTLRFSKDLRLNEENRKRFHDSAKQRVLLYGLENSSVKALQALVILALDLVGCSNGPPGWKLLALLARSVVQLGLAVESSSSLTATMFPSIYTLRANVLPDSKNWVEDESRRRLFWMVYLLDRYSTIATAFDFALNESDIDRRLPCKEELFTKNQPVETRWFDCQERSNYVEQKDNVGSFGFYMEILGILSRIHIFLKRPVDITATSDVEQWQSSYRKLDTELSNWEYNLPKQYSFDSSSRLFMSKASRAVHCGWVMLHATYQTTIIRLHSSAAYPTTRSSIFTPSYSASQRCLTAAGNIHSLARFVVENNVLDKLGPPFAFTLWVSARLFLVHGSTIAHTVSPEINFIVDTLRRMGKYWKVAERYSTLLQRVLDEYAEYEQSVGTAGERVTPSSVKILSDMRRCAFDLDFLISRQPRNSTTTAHNTPRNANTPARSLGPHELEYLDVFAFFNVPRLPALPAQLQTDGLDVSHGTGNDHSNNNSAGHNILGISVNDLGNTAGGDAGGNADSVPTQLTNEFNITNYLIPTPETDWLFQTAT
ncbi:hypothetical protein AJ79_07725 [Helicocarpus griseus UAMH5409]|uniref:Zn(2)-C6 fungal-type domain-containing protein n=1 Tax=Helicocarpus griseus UAMH5409 TaxID=1447875 RepID=A0A2B7X091_9EURO|nr:hypothetical protein AJ79_07725 [Helicocarpus griseus UAMH5409]